MLWFKPGDVLRVTGTPDSAYPAAPDCIGRTPAAKWMNAAGLAKLFSSDQHAVASL
jgi:hypothetical protein